ncbi:uncharacterized protein BKA78DRAFT_325487 [Phyllosticta capitalensis]|uniref:uncharacterized protein n=1 Tax=Phyllosticta capitalensis TaxID=121624 RepID=UPI00313247CB
MVAVQGRACLVDWSWLVSWLLTGWELDDSCEVEGGDSAFSCRRGSCCSMMKERASLAQIWSDRTAVPVAAAGTCTRG